MNDAFEFDYLVFIGRFQPFHQGHYHVVETALHYAKQVIILIELECNPPAFEHGAQSLQGRVRRLCYEADHI